MTLLDTVHALTEAPRPDLSAPRVEDALDVALRGDPDNKNRFLFVMRSFRAAPPIASVELRLPLRGARRKGPLCILELDPAAAPAAAEVSQVFGAPASLLAPRGRSTPSGEAFFVYERPWGALRFGATTPLPSRDGTRERPILTAIVIDIER